MLYMRDKSICMAICFYFFAYLPLKKGFPGCRPPAGRCHSHLCQRGGRWLGKVSPGEAPEGPASPGRRVSPRSSPMAGLGSGGWGGGSYKQSKCIYNRHVVKFLRLVAVWSLPPAILKNSTFPKKSMATGVGIVPVRIPKNFIRPQKKFPGAGPRAYRNCNTVRENRGPASGKVSPGEAPEGPASP